MFCRLFKQLAKKYHRMTQKTTPTTTPTSATPLSPDSEVVFREGADYVSDLYNTILDNNLETETLITVEPPIRTL